MRVSRLIQSVTLGMLLSETASPELGPVSQSIGRDDAGWCGQHVAR